MAGSAIQEEGSTNWYGNTNATNQSGFSAKGAGYREKAYYYDLRYSTGFWTITQNQPLTSYVIFLNNYGTLSQLYEDNNYGYSVRCVRD